MSDAPPMLFAWDGEAMRPLRPKLADEHFVVGERYIVQEATVTRYVARSQSHRAMGKQVFQESKSAVLDVIAAMIEVTPRQLAREAGRAA